MAYLKKEYRELMKKIDKELKFPRGWYYFVKKEQKKHNFIIKNKGICTCNNCNHFQKYAMYMYLVLFCMSFCILGTAHIHLFSFVLGRV